ncbi:MAG TPA: aldo/keto reductase, partial [Sphingomicrobium sp.]|nr:aldo/keto reductase [Sphingomicrobium sp.]
TDAHELSGVAEEAGISLSELAYRYCRHQAEIDVVLTGTGDPAHLRQNIAAALAPPLPDSVLAELHQTAASTRK